MYEPSDSNSDDDDLSSSDGHDSFNGGTTSDMGDDDGSDGDNPNQLTSEPPNKPIQNTTKMNVDCSD